MKRFSTILLLLLLASVVLFAQSEGLKTSRLSSEMKGDITSPAIDGDIIFYGDTQALYTASEGGYVFGNNGYGDLGKYQRFDMDEAGSLESVGLFFGAAEVMGAGANDITLVIKEATGTSITDAPGTTIHSQVFTTAEIISFTDPLIFNFDSPINVGQHFFVGIEWASTFDDSIGLYSDVNGEGDLAYRAWEKWGDGTLHDVYSSWGNMDNDIFIQAEVSTGSGTQVIFTDDFESGTNKWTLEGTWGLATTNYHSETHSLTESPDGQYTNDMDVSATMTNPLDLSAAFGATLKFWAKWEIEDGFDYMYIEITTDGTNWIELDAIDADSDWQELTYDIGGFVGSSTVTIRFRFFSDVGWTEEGMFIDDVVVETSTVDETPPLVLHNGPDFYEQTSSPFSLTANITDISGVAETMVYYTVDGGNEQSVTPSNVAGNDYTFIIPDQLAGQQIDYWIYAKDAADNATVNMPVESYIYGNHVYYDDPEVSFVNSFGPSSEGGLLGCSVRLTVPQDDDIFVTALIRNYTDINRPNDNFEFHIWSDNNGLPGTDIITPFMVTPEANLVSTSPMTRINLRPFMTQLSGLSGDIHIGFMVPEGETWLTQFTPGTALRTNTFNGTTWLTIEDDYHFRGVFGNVNNVPVELTSFTAAQTGNIVSLDWKTATETNNYGFEIQRMVVVGDDKSDWQTLGFKEGMGTTTQPVNYSFEDNIIGLNATEIMYRLKQVDLDGHYVYSDVVKVEQIIPADYSLTQNYPNPFNPTTTIQYALPADNFVTLKVYDILGQEVVSLVNEFQKAGTYNVTFNAANLPSGLYIYNIKAGVDASSSAFSQTMKMMLLK